MTTLELLAQCEIALNQIKNTRLWSPSKFKDSYSLVSAVGNHIRENKPVQEADFFPEVLDKHHYYDDTEIDPIKVVDDNGSCEPCEEEEAQFWSVYMRVFEGGRECIADLPTKTQAEKLAKLIDKLLELQ